MPVYVARLAQDILNRAGLAVHGSRVLSICVTYKAAVADLRESPAVELAVTLGSLGAKVAYLDPYVSEWGTPGVHVERESELLPGLNECDLEIFLQYYKGVNVVPSPLLQHAFLTPEGYCNSTVETR